VSEKRFDNIMMHATDITLSKPNTSKTQTPQAVYLAAFKEQLKFFL
jgi:hypothetical protein